MPKKVAVKKAVKVDAAAMWEMALQAQEVELPGKTRSGKSAHEIKNPILEGDTRKKYFDRKVASPAIACGRALKAYYVSGGTEGIDHAIHAALNVLLALRVAKKIGR